MGSECVLTAEQLEVMTSGDGKGKLPSISGMYLQGGLHCRDTPVNFGVRR